MKKTLIALSVAGFVASSANAATIYDNNGTKLEVGGSARVMLTQASGVTNYRLDLRNDDSRIKFKFSQQIDDGFSALGFMELRPGDKDFNGGITTKYLYAGLQVDDVGTLTFGNQKTAGDAFKLADPSEQSQNYSILNAMGIIKESQKVINFTSANYYGLGLQASYIFDPSAAKFGSNGKDYNGNRNGYQILAKYEDTFDGVGVKVHALYSHDKHDPVYANDRGMYAQVTWGLAAAVNVADFGFAFDYVSTKLSKGEQPTGLYVFNSKGEPQRVPFKTGKGLQVALTYQVFEPMDIYAIYQHYGYTSTLGQQKYESNKNTWTYKSVNNNLIVGTHYYLTKNVMTYLEYVRITETGYVPDNKAYLGLRVFF